MTRSLRFRHHAPALALPILLLAAVGCGGGGEATADTVAHGQAADGPAGPDASTAGGSTVAASGTGGGSASTLPAPDGSAATAGGATAVGVSVETATTAGPRTTVPPTSARSTTVSTAATGSTATTATTATTSQPASQLLAGTVTASPTCPVERPDQPCPPRPIAAHIEVFDRSEQLVTSTDADAEGRFALTLAPGRYLVTASSGAVFPSCPPLTIDVPTGGEARADIHCDTGIR